MESLHRNSTVQAMKMAMPPVTGVGTACALRPAGWSSRFNRRASGCSSHSNAAVRAKAATAESGSIPWNFWNMPLPPCRWGQSNDFRQGRQHARG